TRRVVDRETQSPRSRLQAGVVQEDRGVLGEDVKPEREDDERERAPPTPASRRLALVPDDIARCCRHVQPRSPDRHRYRGSTVNVKRSAQVKPAIDACECPRSAPSGRLLPPPRETA